MKIAYFDCFSGVSGDMILGALMDLGVPQDYLDAQIRALPLEGYHFEVRTVQRMGVHGKHLTVVMDSDSVPSRKYRDIRVLLENSALHEQVKRGSLKTFLRLAEIEAHIHGCPVEEVHFHEIGAVDTIVDVVGAFLGMKWLGIEKVVASEIPLGKGFVRCAHGMLPVPAPATVALLENIPVYGTDIPHELVTPTGAAILTSLAERFGPIPRLRTEAVGYGAGERELEQRPNLLRIILGDERVLLSGDSVTIVETNIDDMNPELFGYVMEVLFSDGALDVLWIPVFMKKNRPGTLVKVICRNEDRDKMVGRILSETTATGVRHYETTRTRLPRREKQVSTTFGLVQVKEFEDLSGRVFTVPEYEACKQIALDRKIPLKVVYETIRRDISA